MEIGGIKRSSLKDYPKKVSCIIWTVGCNFRCPYCYNPDLVFGREEKLQMIKEEDFFNFLKSREGLLDGVVITGGEPTIQSDLGRFVKKIKRKGFLVKLDTNGSKPSILRNLIGKDLLDYIAMDVKLPKERYSELTSVEGIASKVEKSVELVKSSGVDYEFRTTVVPRLLDKEAVKKIADWIAPAEKYFLQNFESRGNLIDPSFEKVEPYEKEFLKSLLEKIKGKFEVCKLRA